MTKQCEGEVLIYKSPERCKETKGLLYSYRGLLLCKDCRAEEKYQSPKCLFFEAISKDN